MITYSISTWTIKSTTGSMIMYMHCVRSDVGVLFSTGRERHEYLKCCVRPWCVSVCVFVMLRPRNAFYCFQLSSALLWKLWYHHWPNFSFSCYWSVLHWTFFTRRFFEKASKWTCAGGSECRSRTCGKASQKTMLNGCRVFSRVWSQIDLVNNFG